METWQLIGLAGLGVIAGILNVIAGGGSVLTLPAMVFLGMDGPFANGSNRVAIFAQSLTAIAGFKRKGFSDFRLSCSLALATIPGAIAGAYLGTVVRGVVFNRVLAVIMFLILIQMLFKGRKGSKASTGDSAPTELTPQRMVLGHLCMVGVGFYGGFIQAGVGFLLMAALHNVMGIDLVRVNMHKVFIVAAFALVALIVFISTGHVLWVPAIALAVGTSLGGWIGSQLSVSKGEKFIEKILIVALAVMAVWLLFVR